MIRYVIPSVSSQIADKLYELKQMPTVFLIWEAMCGSGVTTVMMIITTLGAKMSVENPVQTQQVRITAHVGVFFGAATGRYIRRPQKTAPKSSLAGKDTGDFEGIAEQIISAL